jgi:hypothetical protein
MGQACLTLRNKDVPTTDEVPGGLADKLVPIETDNGEIDL